MRENRAENALAYMAAGVVGVSILVILYILAGMFFKWAVPGAIKLIPVIGLPVGFLLIISLLITSMVRKARENR